MAQIARTEPEKATDNAKKATDRVAEQGQRTANQAAAVKQEATDRAEDMAGHSFHVVQRAAGAMAEVERAVARRSAEATAELGQVFVDLVGQQTRQNFATLQALSEAVDWDQVAKAVDWGRVLHIQSEYLRASLERTVQLTRRYLEVSQAVVTQAASTAEREAKKAAV